MGIGSTLKRLRTEKGLTQKELAAKVIGGLDYTYIGKIERDEQLPSLKILLKISEALAVPLNSFFIEDTEELVLSSCSEKVTSFNVAKDRFTLQKELNQLHSNDLQLVIEIVRALNKHRKHECKTGYCQAEGNFNLVAEKKPDYDKD